MRRAWESSAAGGWCFTGCGSRRSSSCWRRLLGCRDGRHHRPVPRIVEHYAKQVNQRRLAAAATLKWEAADESRVTKPKKA